MSFKSILCVIGVKQSDRDIQDAVKLCTEINAHLSILIVALAAPPPMGKHATALSGSWLEERAAGFARLKARVERVTALAAKTALSCDVDSEYPEFASADRVIGRRARYADLTVVGADLLEDSDLKGPAIDGGLFESGRPLLIVPAGSKPTLQPKNVLLAWDARVEAARAAHEAIELLAGAVYVHVTLVDPESAFGRDGPEPGADIGAYLARHGVKVIVDRLPSAGQAIADVLRQHAVDICADMIVMGAYGHSRLRERIFGGITRSMIDEPPLAVFMAH
jgi:nucleotide-binding universal stress UspA family protein